MKHTVDSDIVEKAGININEFLLLLILTNGGDIQQCMNSLLEKKWAERHIYNQDKLVLTLDTKKKVHDILIDCNEKVKGKQADFDSLADKLRELFPKGYKEGTNYPWRGSRAEISKKLKNLVVKYGCEFTEEEAIEATKAYVASFNGNHRFMKLLKYFLLKTPVNNNGDVEIESEFMTYLENRDMEKERNNDNWMIDLA